MWNPDALLKQHEENASAGRLFLRLVSDPLGKNILAKVIGKAIAQKAFVAIANRILTSAVVKQLLKKLGASTAMSKPGPASHSRSSPPSA